MKPSLSNDETTKNGLKECAVNVDSNCLTEEEQLEILAKLIIDIYFDLEHEKSKQ